MRPAIGLALMLLGVMAGPVHRYFFKLYALGKKVNIPPRATKQQVVDAIASHTLGEAQWMGTYKR